MDENAPVCECHGQPMRWNADPRLRAGGSWRCRVKTVEAQTRWQRGPGRETHNAIHRRRYARRRRPG